MFDCTLGAFVCGRERTSELVVKVLAAPTPPPLAPPHHRIFLHMQGDHDLYAQVNTFQMKLIF